MDKIKWPCKSKTVERMNPDELNNQMKIKTTPPWKIKALKEASKRLQFDSFDLFPDNRKAGIYMSALLRGGLVEVTGSDAWRNNRYEISLKGLKFLEETEV